MTKELFEGVITPLFIPLDEQERVIEQDLAKHVGILLDRGINGFLVPSATGEFYNLIPEQRRRSTEIVVQAVAGQVPVISMISDCGTRNALGHIADARRAGADAVMADPPYYTPVNQKNLKRFFNTLADEGGLPLWLYHQPFHTKLTIEPQTVRELAENPNIVGIKASAWTDIFYFQQILRAVADKPEFRVLMGEDINELSGLILGGHGLVSTLSNLIPEELLAIWQALNKADIAAARKIQNRITDVEELVIIDCESWQGAGKYVLHKRGVFSTTVISSPSHPLTEEDVQKLESRGPKLGLF